MNSDIKFTKEELVFLIAVAQGKILASIFTLEKIDVQMWSNIEKKLKSMLNILQEKNEQFKS